MTATDAGARVPAPTRAATSAAALLPPAVPPPPLPWWWRWLSPIQALAAIALLPVAAATTDLDGLTGWGLAQVLGPAAWVAIVLAVSACVTELWSPRPRIGVLTFVTAVLILCTTGLPSVVEEQARTSTAWLIGGFVDAIAGDGVAPTSVDARFFWPAFFAQWAWFRDAGGADSLDGVLRWFPPVVVAVWATGVYALARSMLGGSRAPWVAAWLFLGLNWIEQDYFSPQATAIVLLLTVLTFALGPLATRRRDPSGPGGRLTVNGYTRPGRIQRWIAAARTPPDRPPVPPRQLLLIYLCSALCLLAIAVSHQLTPYAIIGQLTVLAVFGRFRGRGLLLVAVLALVVYFIIGTREFWTVQLGLVTGGGEDVVQAALFNRVSGDQGQVTVKLLRVIVPIASWVLGLLGAWAYYHRKRDLVPVLLAIVPVGLAAAQSYGGELFLRIALYGLPILAVLGTEALRTMVRSRRSLEGPLALGMVGLFALLVVIRGGNEAYTLVRTDEVAMTRQVLATTQPGLKIHSLNGIGPRGVAGIDTFNILGVYAPGCAELSDDPLRCVELDQPDVLLIYHSIEQQGIVLQGKPPGWTKDVIRQLVAGGTYKVTFQEGFNAVLTRVAPVVDVVP
ncbi:MAG: hypothetical protein ACRDTD_18270 [Pseudonocardiaceae bacterium]